MDKGHSVINTSPKIRIIKPKRLEKEGSVLLDIEYVVRDKDGNEVSRKQEYGDSFVANFIKILFCACMKHHAPDTGSVVTLTDTSNTVRTGSVIWAAYNATGTYKCNALSGNDDYGLLVGTGITPTDINDYALDTKIEEGTGAGQMEYGNHSIVNSTHDGSSYSYAGITRTVANNSGGSIVVAEVGLVCYMDWDSSTDRCFLLIREVLGTAVTVLDTQTLTATVRIKCYC
ncbi:MAG: hypothetical protein HWN68_10005 [Desulfobacterales bacterium]|nr:hypothetical protein [Desulfobacterales bacterium]